MILLHISLIDDEILLWAETPVSREKSIVANVPDEDGAPAKHPFAAPGKILLDTITGATHFVRPAQKLVASVAVWLPSYGGAPLPSNPLLAGEAVQEAQSTKLTAWIVDAIRLTPAELIDLIASCQRGHILAPGVFIGQEFAYFENAIRLTASLVVRQQYLPSMSQVNQSRRDACAPGGNQSRQDACAPGGSQSYHALWEPVLMGEDHCQLARLSQVMPPVVRAISSHTQQNEPPAHSRQAATRALVGALTDSIVKEKQPSKPAKEYASVHDGWLAALKSPASKAGGTPALPGTALSGTALAGLSQFADQLHQWQQPVTSGQAAPFKLCFRLEEPEATPHEDDQTGQGLISALGAEVSAEWKVTYLLQSLNDKSLLIPAAQAWHNARNVKSTFASYKFNPRQFLLQSLGQASRLCDEINTGLIKNDLDGYELDNVGAFEFLSDKAQALQEADFGVMLPSWWKKGRRKLRVSAKVTSAPRKKSELSLDTLVQFEWQVALGDQPLTIQELNALAALKTPLINIRGQWIHVSQEDIKMAIELLKKKANSKARLGDVLKLRIGAMSALGSLDNVEVIADGWVGDLLEKLEEPASLEELCAPAGFRGQLRHYQQRGYSWLAFLSQWGLGACLADDMGLGKTIQTLALIQNHRTAGNTAPVLLVCPTSVINNWLKESDRFTPELKVLIHHGPNRNKGAKFLQAAADHAIVISSYALIHRDVGDLRCVKWAGVILDEAQNIKNAFTKQSVAVRDISSPYRVALTGTPVENSVADLWSIMDFLNPGLLGDNKHFRKNFFNPIEIGHDSETTEKLLKITQPFILRRLKTDKTIIDDLPEKQEMKVYCSMTKEQVTLYSAVTKDLEKKLQTAQGIERSGLVLSTLSRLKQVCNHPAHFLGDQSSLSGRSGKLIRAQEITEEILTAGEKLLIFSQFKEMGSLIKQDLEEKFGEQVLFLHGGVSKKERDQMVERFQSTDGPSVFMLSLKAGGTGLNLTTANHVIHYDRWWNPAVENQASDRAFRIGQTKMVQVRKFICVGTLEEKIDNMIEGKAAVAEAVVGSGEGWLTKLSNDELRDVLCLSKEALVDD